MEVQELISERKELYTNFMNMIEAADDSQSYLSFVDLCERKEIKEKREEIMFIMHMMIEVSENHYRNANFFDKIEKIIFHFKDQIKQALSDSELYLLCKNNKRMLYFMFKEKNH